MGGRIRLSIVSEPTSGSHMPTEIQIVTRPVRQITVDTGRRWSDFRADYDRAVPSFDRLEAIGVVLSDSGWDAITRLSDATAVRGLVNFFMFDPSPVMHLNGATGNAVGRPRPSPQRDSSAVVTQPTIRQIDSAASDSAASRTGVYREGADYRASAMSRLANFRSTPPPRAPSASTLPNRTTASMLSRPLASQ
jgi:hypothetical protein